MGELLVSCQELSKSFDGTRLFAGLSFGIEEGDHIGVVGPNGSGKSTLLRILAGTEPASSGTRAARRRLRIGYVAQDPAFAPEATVSFVLASALEDSGLEPHEAEGQIAVAMGKAGFDEPARPVATLSGGWKKRLAIARALVTEPDLLLLDEPTNHLDLDGILWLEDLLQHESEAFLAVSHDRYFLEAVAGRLLEINRVFPSGLLEVRGNYSTYLETKDALLAGQAAYQDSLRNRVRGELEWLSRKARARRRQSKARIDEAGRLKGELEELDARTSTAAAAIEFATTDRRPKRLIVATGLAKSFGDRILVRDLDLVLTPGLRLGLVGANGSGKTTLLRLLAGLDSPERGTVERAEGVKVVVFDQHRARLDPAVSLRRTLAPAGDSVIHQDRAVHVAGWAKRFLFRADQLDLPVGRLSGGEQARVLIARLMLEPADVLMLDEPTNDLDIPTLEVLEESLLEFPGALVLVTHDRYLLDRVSTRLLAIDGRGGAVPYADSTQWEMARAAKPVPKTVRPAGSPAPAPARSKKLSYLEQREWEQIESRIVAAEQERDSRARAASDPAIASDHAALSQRLAALTEAATKVDALYARWAELQAKQEA